LRGVATEELANPSATPQMVVLADKWWEMGDSASDQRTAEAMKGRANIWYARSLPSLTGLDRVRVEKRLGNHSPTSRQVTERGASAAQDNGDKDIAAVLLHKRELTEQIPITLYRSGRFSTPTSTTAWTRQTWWTVQHSMVVMIYADPKQDTGYGIDVGLLDNTGLRYTGFDQQGRKFSGQITKMSPDWTRLKDAGPLAGQPKADLVAHIAYKSSKMKKHIENRLLANGHVNDLDSDDRWVILNRHIIITFKGKQFWVDTIKVNPDGTLTGSNQENVSFKGRVIKSTPLFDKLLNAK
jgi:hypothetical protein